MAYTTEQEAFWAGEYGQDYLARCSDEERVDVLVDFFKKMLRSAAGLTSAVELGCNIGLNLQALERIYPAIELSGYDHFEDATTRAEQLGIADIRCETVIEPIDAGRTFDLAFTKGTLIHINPDKTAGVYKNLFNLTRRYILVCEFYNPTLVTVNYRGYENILFKKDFCGELMDAYPLRLVDYGFEYHRIHPIYADFTWFLLEK